MLFIKGGTGWSINESLMADLGDDSSGVRMVFPA